MENIITSMFTLRRKLSQIMPNWQQYLIQTINYDKVFLKLLLLALRTFKLKNQEWPQASQYSDGA